VDDVDRALELYKLTLEMADRTTARRFSLTNIFVTLAASLLAAMGFSAAGAVGSTGSSTPVSVALGSVGLLLCVNWWALIASHRQLLQAKYQVLFNLETALPFRPASDEWKQLMQARVSLGGRYGFGTRVEQAVPVGFAAAFAVAIAVAVF